MTVWNLTSRKSGDVDESVECRLERHASDFAFRWIGKYPHNANRKNADLKFFEFGNCYYFNAEKKNPEKVLAAYSEDYHLGIVGDRQDV